MLEIDPILITFASGETFPDTTPEKLLSTSSSYFSIASASEVANTSSFTSSNV